ncbi:hypothetical protein [Actinomadura sp. KC216]|uniref:hypothetical protein n=1 Tax=Actinomadura sp. KC216 TaxID=2530370 RepID=UPI0014051006|nr:hypothetical protein [Actinomadura sp. KC216]
MLSTDQRPHEVRFSLLADLYLKLGDRELGTSMLVHPTDGESVLWVAGRGLRTVGVR